MLMLSGIYGVVLVNAVVEVDAVGHEVVLLQYTVCPVALFTVLQEYMLLKK